MHTPSTITLTSRTAKVLALVMLVASTVAIAACGGDAHDKSSIDGELLAIDARSGRELWRAQPPGGAVGVPVAADGQVFVLTSDDCDSSETKIVAYDSATGEEQWQAQAGGGCFDSSISVANGVVVTRGEQQVLGLSADTGEVSWSAQDPDGPRIFLEPIDAQGFVILRDYYGADLRTRALDRQTGQERWVVESTLTGRDLPYPSAAAARLIYFSSSGIQADEWSLTTIELKTGEQRILGNVGGKGTKAASLATTQDRALVRFGSYPGGGTEQALNIVAAVDPLTGLESWHYEEPGDPFAELDDPLAEIGHLFMGLWAAEANVYFWGTGQSGDILTALDAASGAPRWRVPQEAGAVVGGTDGVVVLMDPSRVLTFDAATGSRLWQTGVPSWSPSRSPAVSGGTVYFHLSQEVPGWNGPGEDTAPKSTIPPIREPSPHDEVSIDALARRTIELLPAGQWPAHYEDFTPEFQRGCREEDFISIGTRSTSELGPALPLLAYKRLDQVRVRSNTATAVIVADVRGQSELSVQAAFERVDRVWKLAQAEGALGCEAFRRFPNAQAAPEPPEGYAEQQTYGDCTSRPPGMVCLGFDDGYTWLIYDTILGRDERGVWVLAWDERGGWRVGRIAVVVAESADYYHVLGTQFVRIQPK